MYRTSIAVLKNMMHFATYLHHIFVL